MVQMGLTAAVEAPWGSLISDDEWQVYSSVMLRARESGIRFALGGGTAFSHYSRRWRNSKDMDFYVSPRDRERMIEVVRSVGLQDYFEVTPYDRAWIYRSHNGGGVIVDVMWQMANSRAEVDEGWLTRGEIVRIRQMRVRMLPPEELIWAKLYVVQRDRCDWGDLLNIIFVQGETLDWEHLLARVGEDDRMLAALMNVFAWMCPGRAARFPRSLWERLGMRAPHGMDADVNLERVRLLDSREWFGPTHPGEDGPGLRR